MNITYSKAVYNTDNHILYWSAGTEAANLCDCSLNRCTRLASDQWPPNSTTTSITAAFPAWPSVGSPGCQFGRKSYDTDFPVDNKVYYLCVSKDINYKGYNVQTSPEGTPENVRLSLNIVAAAATPTTTTKPVPASSSALAPLFAIVVAVLGAFLL